MWNGLITQLCNIGYLFWIPPRAFKAVSNEPRSFVVVVLLMGSALGAHIATQGRIDHDALARQVAMKQKMTPQGAGENRPKEMTESDLEEQTNRAKASMNIFGYFTIPLGILMKVFLVGLAIYVLYAAWKKQVGFKTCWGLGAYVCAPFILLHLLSIPVICQYPSVDPQMIDHLFQTNLAYLLGKKDGVPILYWIDPLVIWIAVLFGLAGRTIGRGKICCVSIGVVFWALLQLSQGLLEGAAKGV